MLNEIDVSLFPSCVGCSEEMPCPMCLYESLNEDSEQTNADQKLQILGDYYTTLLNLTTQYRRELIEKYSKTTEDSNRAYLINMTRLQQSTNLAEDLKSDSGTDSVEDDELDVDAGDDSNDGVDMRHDEGVLKQLFDN